MRRVDCIDVNVRFVPHYGYLPIVTVSYSDNTKEEVYRGEFKGTYENASSDAKYRADILIDAVKKM